DRIRITAQLIDAVSGHHLWSERFDRNIDDLFAIQDELTQTIVTTMTGRLEDAEIGNASRKRTDSLSAYDCLLRGVEQLRAYGPDVNHRARALFEQAISPDPRYDLAHAHLRLSRIIDGDRERLRQRIRCNQATRAGIGRYRCKAGSSRKPMPRFSRTSPPLPQRIRSGDLAPGARTGAQP